MGRRKYQAKISKGLAEALARAETLSWQIDQTRLIAFSDLHRGQRDHADDFQQCEKTYHRALDYYLENGYTLLVLGDIEELWEGWPAKVVRAYESSLKLEAQFGQADDDRYIRVWGNHDDLWQYPREITKHLTAILGDIDVAEGLVVRLNAGADELGRVFFVHGHQGTEGSARWGRLSRHFVRWGWRPIQRLFKIKLTTPASDFKLRGKHDRAMYAWAAGEPGLVLIAGHTHHPVFVSHPQVETLERVYRQYTEGPDGSAAGRESEQKRHAKAELEWARADAAGPDVDRGRDRDRPCYFNAGCCSFSNGDVTGIEIADGEIRLVRWSTDQGGPSERILEAKNLRNVFCELTT